VRLEKALGEVMAPQLIGDGLACCNSPAGQGKTPPANGWQFQRGPVICEEDQGAAVALETRGSDVTSAVLAANMSAKSIVSRMKYEAVPRRFGIYCSRAGRFVE
jgi:hypothetical protein